MCSNNCLVQRFSKARYRLMQGAHAACCNARYWHHWHKQTHPSLSNLSSSGHQRRISEISSYWFETSWASHEASSKVIIASSIVSDDEVFTRNEEWLWPVPVKQRKVWSPMTQLHSCYCYIKPHTFKHWSWRNWGSCIPLVESVTCFQCIKRYLALENRWPRRLIKHIF